MRYKIRTTSDHFAVHCIIPHARFRDGFIALIAVILLATGTLAFSLVTISAAISYSESVNLHELRIQAGLNVKACLDSATLMVAKDYFLNGEVELPEFGCTLTVTNDFQGHINLNVRAVFEGVGDVESTLINLGSD